MEITKIRDKEHQHYCNFRTKPQILINYLQAFGRNCCKYHVLQKHYFVQTTDEIGCRI